MKTTSCSDEAEAADRLSEKRAAPPPCEVRLVRYKFRTAGGQDREVVLLAHHGYEFTDDIGFLEANFGGPFQKVSRVDDPWVDELWLPEVLLTDGRRSF